MSYFIGLNGGSGFGSNGNFFEQVGEIGPAWQATQNQAIKNQQLMDEFRYNQQLAPYKLQNDVNYYQALNLQNELQHTQNADRQRIYETQRRLGLRVPSEQVGADWGVNFNYPSGNVTPQSPQQGQPNTPVTQSNLAVSAPNASPQAGYLNGFQRYTGWRQPTPMYNALQDNLVLGNANWATNNIGLPDGSFNRGEAGLL